MIAFALPFLVAAVVTVRVDVTPAHTVNTIRPLRALGAGIDSDPLGKIALLYAPARVRATLAAGLGSLSYRLYTELSIQDWQWNPAGTFSDAAGERGYWTSSASTRRPGIVDSFGYLLPRRGSTRDQGDDDGYSRIDDGDPSTVWKSDPYLTRAYTGEPDTAHPQWIVVDFGSRRPVDAVRIAWSHPYATTYDVEYWSGGDAILDQGSGAWHPFARGRISYGRGGTVTLRVAAAPVHARFYRVLMSASSGTCDAGGAADRRNCVGYAIAELGMGTIGARGVFRDGIVHVRCGGNPERPSPCGVRQTIVFASSTDPWHTARDRVRGGQDQTGLDTIARNPITRGLPVMYPVPMLYSTPENAVAEIRYLRARGYPIAYVEMGEEPDGQYVIPEDYGALYVQWARAIHAVAPSVRLGGPIFEGVNSDVAVWRDRSGDTSWLHRFVAYLKRRGALGELAFMSFEHYPFAGCDRGAVLQRHLLREASIVRAIVATWRRDGLPRGLPMFITEGNYAADGGPVPQRLEGALWWADYIGSALAAGVARIYHYQYEAEPLGRDPRCSAYGNYGMFVTDGAYRIRARAAQFYAAQMLARRWLEPGDRVHRIAPAATNDQPFVSAYAAHRPDGTWSLLVVNKDRVAHRLDPLFTDGRMRSRFAGSVTTAVFGAAQYAWSGRSQTEIPHSNDPPAVQTLPGTANLTVPGRSLFVVTGRLAP